MRKVISVFILSLACNFSLANDLTWPNGEKAAVTLSYRDSLSSQLEHAVPVLNKYGLKGAFYLALSSPDFHKHFSEWKKVATQGHELGNQTLYHPCSGSKPDRDWVLPYRDLDHYQLNEIVDEIKTANVFLHAIDGKTHRTFGFPCGENIAGGKDFWPEVKPLFSAMMVGPGEKITSMASVNIHKMTDWPVYDVTGKELIDYVKDAAENGTIANITFHGVGGDYLKVSPKAHEQLVRYLADNQDVYWVDTFYNVTRYIDNAK